MVDDAVWADNDAVEDHFVFDGDVFSQNAHLREARPVADFRAPPDDARVNADAGANDGTVEYHNIVEVARRPDAHVLANDDVLSDDAVVPD